MTAKDFVELCFKNKEEVLRLYFSENIQTEVGRQIDELVKKGTNKDELKEIIDLVLKETYYGFLLALDGSAQLGDVQRDYKVYDDENNLLNPCGDFEAEASDIFNL